MLGGAAVDRLTLMSIALAVAGGGCESRHAPIEAPQRAVAPAPAASLRCGRWPELAAPDASSPPDAGAPRALTDGELALVRPLFGDSVDYASVRVHPDRYTIVQVDGTYMTPNGSIYAPGELFRADFAATEPSLQAVFVHEMTHVWQHQNGVDLFQAWLDEVERHEGDYWAAYPYRLTAGRDLLDYGVEQQASIVEDYFLRCAFDQGPLNLVDPPDDAAERDALYASVLSGLLTDPAYIRRHARQAAR
jgi:hypothetical protein